MGGEFLSFDEALAELQMGTHELRSLVAQGEIRAFRDEDILRFRRTDVLELKKSRDTRPGGLVVGPGDIGDEEPTVVSGPESPAPGRPVSGKGREHEIAETKLLAGVGKESSADFLGLDDTAAGLGDGSDTAQTVVPTIEISDEDMIDETAQTVIPTVATDKETDLFSKAGTPVGQAAPALLADEEDASEMGTQEIIAEDVAPTSAAGLAAETVKDEPLGFRDSEAGISTVGGELGISTGDVAGATATVTATRRSQRYLAEAATPTASPIFLILAILTFAILLFAIPIFYGMTQDQRPTFAPYRGMLQYLADKTIGQK